MARYDAIAQACEALRRLLENAYPGNLVTDDDGTDATVQFQVLRGQDFPAADSPAVTLFLHRIAIDGNLSVHSRVGSGGLGVRPQVGLDLHVLMTAWAKTAPMQHVLLGWAMRVLADYPVLPASLLDSTGAGVFHQDETLHLRPGDSTVDDVTRLWDQLGGQYEVSVPYVLTGLRLDSEREVGGGLVVETHLRHGEALQ